MIKNFTIVLLFIFSGASVTAQGLETFTNMPANNSSYLVRNWTGDNGITWTVNDARTDQTINGRALGYRNGTLTSGTIPNGVGDLSFQYKYLFTGSNASLTVRVNNIVVGTITVLSTQTTPATATLSNINIAGNVVIEIQQTVSGARVAIDDLTWTAAGPACTPPVTQATSASVNNIATTTFEVTWTAGSGTNSLVVIKSGTAVASSPVSGTSYTANAVFATGGTISAGEYVVYNGTGNSVSVSGLTSGTQYHASVYTFNSADNCYNTTSPAVTSAVTTCTEPTVQVGTINISPFTTSANISWSGGNGGSSIVKLNTANSFTTPMDGTTYTASTAYVSGEQVMFAGTGSTVNVTGLVSNTSYYVTVYTYNNCAGIPDYLTAGNLVQAFTTISAANYYSSITTQTCEALKTALSTIISNGVIQLNYGAIDDTYHPTTDDHLNDAGTQTIVWDMYSDNPSGAEPYTYTFAQAGSSASAEGQGWNKEHTFPNSWFSTTSSTNNFPGSDLHQIVPTDIYVNSQRGNLPYGTVGTITTTYLNGSKKGISATPIPGYSGEVFEPIDSYKGDLARITLYMVTRYQADVPTWENYQLTGDVVMDGLTYPSIEPGYLQMLLAWHAADPVSQKEIDRNEDVFGFQGNRNPFVDHPEWVNAIWGTACLAVPVRLIEFTGTKKNETVILNWAVASEINFSRYEIERSTDGSRFDKIGMVAGSNLGNYSFDDTNLPSNGVSFYRLKLVDIDGNFTNSKTVIIKLKNDFSNAIIYPNPALYNLQVLLTKGLSLTSRLEVSDVTGRIVAQKNIAAGSVNIPVDVSFLPAGRFIIRIVNKNEVITQSLVIVK